VPGALPVWNATERTDLWPDFVSNVPSCIHLLQCTSEDGEPIAPQAPISPAARNQTILECLRKASEEEIKETILNPEDPTFQGEWWQPTIDRTNGTVFPDFPSRLYENGTFAKIPFIAGNNLDEGKALLLSSPHQD
jgi:acetylcholinesterase